MSEKKKNPDPPTLRPVQVTDLVEALALVAFVHGSLYRLEEDVDAEVLDLTKATSILKRCLGCKEEDDE